MRLIRVNYQLINSSTGSRRLSNPGPRRVSFTSSLLLLADIRIPCPSTDGQLVWLSTPRRLLSTHPPHTPCHTGVGAGAPGKGTACRSSQLHARVHPGPCIDKHPHRVCGAGAARASMAEHLALGSGPNRSRVVRACADASSVSL